MGICNSKSAKTKKNIFIDQLSATLHTLIKRLPVIEVTKFSANVILSQSKLTLLNNN